MSKRASGSDKSGAHDGLSESERAALFESTGEKHYQWPPPRDPNLSYTTKSRNPVQSVLAALPVLMLVSGLYIYYQAESRQTQGAPIRAEAVQLSGIFTGLSVTSDRHYLWLEQAGQTTSVRITAEQLPLLEALQRNVPVTVKAAPTVHASNTQWVWYVEQSGELYLDDSDKLTGN